MRIGVDLGGTKIEALAIDAAGRELLRRRVPTPAGAYDEVVDAVRGLVDALESELGARARVGVGTPGAISRALRREVRTENDANCFALSEAIDGAGAGHRSVFGVILGTGVGGGLVFDGRLWTGRNAIEGEWGHNEMPSRTETALPSTTCYCGRARCIETYLSGPGLAADHARVAGGSLDAAAIGRRAEAGDADASATLDRYANRLASALAVVVNVIDPDIVVVGGGVSNLEALYARVAARLPLHVFSDTCTTPVVRNRHGDSSGVRGAAWLWPAGGERG
jgi:fructokinase